MESIKSELRNIERRGCWERVRRADLLSFSGTDSSVCLPEHGGVRSSEMLPQVEINLSAGPYEISQLHHFGVYTLQCS